MDFKENNMKKDNWNQFIDEHINDDEFEQEQEDGYVDEEDDFARSFNAGWDYEPPSDEDEEGNGEEEEDA
jgi:hypothetical protein